MSGSGARYRLAPLVAALLRARCRTGTGHTGPLVTPKPGCRAQTRGWVVSWLRLPALLARTGRTPPTMRRCGSNPRRPARL